MMPRIGQHTVLQEGSGLQQYRMSKSAAEDLQHLRPLTHASWRQRGGSNKRHTQMELDKAAAIVDQAGRDASREADAVGGERAEGAARQLAQPPLQRRQRGDQRPGQPGVVVQVEVAQALGIRQGAEDVQSRALHTDPSDLLHCGNMPKILGPSVHLSPITYR